MPFASLPRRRFVPRLDRLEDRTLLTVCVVDRLTDLGEGEKLRGDLRYCINESNQLPGDDTITFEVTGTINLTRALPDLSSNIDIQGPGPAALTVRRSQDMSTPPFYRILTVSSGTVNIFGVTITRGGYPSGGAIFNAGTLTVSHTTIIGNVSGGDIEATGGAIFNRGTLTVLNSTIANNSAYIESKSEIVAARGGGIYSVGTLAVSNTTIVANDARAYSTPRSLSVGGGVYSEGTMSLSNSTISGNDLDALSTEGGGIYNAGTLTVGNSTISNNGTAAGIMHGGGIRNGRTLYLRNTIVALNYALSGSDLFGTLTSSGYNLIGNSQGGSGYDKTDLLDVDPLLGPLQDNGGPTWTHALLPGSPALDSGDNTDAPEWDQRGEGFPRIVNDIIDRGAFEVQARGAGPAGHQARLDAAFILGWTPAPRQFVPPLTPTALHIPAQGQRSATLGRQGQESRSPTQKRLDNEAGPRGLCNPFRVDVGLFGLGDPGWRCADPGLRNPTPSA